MESFLKRWRISHPPPKKKTLRLGLSLSLTAPLQHFPAVITHWLSSFCCFLINYLEFCHSYCFLNSLFCSFWQSSQTVMQWCVPSTVFYWEYNNDRCPLPSCAPSYLRRGSTWCCTGLICGLTGRGNTCWTLCSHAAPGHSLSKDFF